RPHSQRTVRGRRGRRDAQNPRRSGRTVAKGTRRMSALVLELPLGEPVETRERRRVPRLEAGDVHVWQVLLDAPLSGLDHEVLSDDERERAERFRFQRDRMRFVAGRARLRRILGTYLDREPATLVFI